MRKITSLTATLAFILMLLTSIILFIVPQGRVAYWADWRMWGLTKTQWGDIHINVGLLFLMALCIHIYFNWKPLVAYLKNRSRRIKIFTPSFNMALAVCLLTVSGTLFMTPPFSWVLDLNASFKNAGTKQYGEPPYGHAERSSLDTFAKKVGIDAAMARQPLENAGYQVAGGNQTLQALASTNSTTPRALYEVIKPPEVTVTRQSKMPDTPPPGAGRLTLADICSRYGLDAQLIVAAQRGKNITVIKNESLRDIAQRHGMGPVDVYDIILTAASTAL